MKLGGDVNMGGGCFEYVCRDSRERLSAHFKNMDCSAASSCFPLQAPPTVGSFLPQLAFFVAEPASYLYL